MSESCVLAGQGGAAVVYYELSNMSVICAGRQHACI